VLPAQHAGCSQSRTAHAYHWRFTTLTICLTCCHPPFPSPSHHTPKPTPSTPPQVSAEEWEAISDVGDRTIKKRPRFAAFAPCSSSASPSPPPLQVSAEE
jgi:hypothetical protein